MDLNKVGTMMQSAAKVPISELNECITCKLCRGYFIDATTIIECLHTFCRSCIVRYLESNKYCPICDVQVHKTKPLLNLRPDKTIQALVYKLVSRLYQNEIQRRKSFYETHHEGKPTAAEQALESQYDYILAPEESVNITLNYHGCCAAPRYLLCPSAVLVTHIKKLIRAKYGLTEHHRVDVFYNQDCLNPSFSLMDISYIYSWKRKDPLDLTYKIYECRAKKPKLETTERNENNVNNSVNNNNNNNWKEVQLRISENGEMSITGIEDSRMLELLDATENFKNEIVINEGKNLENFPKPIQVDTDIGNSEVKIQANHSVSIDSHAKPSENAPTTNKQLENAQKSVENHVTAPKKELPGLKVIGKSSASSCTTSTVTSTKTACLGTKAAKSSTKVVNSGTKTGNSALKSGNSTPKTANSASKGASTGSKASLEGRKTSTSCTEATRISCSATSTKTSNTKSTRASSDLKMPKNSSSLTHTMPKSMELSATLNLNSELSVIPLGASTSCVSLSSCGGTTTVFSTINKSMCSTRMETSDCQGSGDGNDKTQGLMFNSKENHIEAEKELNVNNICKEPKKLKRKCEEEGKPPEVPTKLPKPTILNHSIGLMNLSNNHPLKKHSKMNRNGEHLLRTPEIGEKVPISTPTLTVNHVSVSQKHISMDITPSKPIIINKNVSNLQINRPGTPKSGQRGGQGGNVPCYGSKAMYNSVGGLVKLNERNGEKLETSLGQTEIINSTVNCISKPPLNHPIHHAPAYQTSHHTPIITPSQLPHHQNLNSLQLKPTVCSNSTHNQERNDKTTSQGNTATSQSNVASSQANTSQSSAATSQSNVACLKTSVATTVSTSQSNMTPTSQKLSDVPQESSQSPSKPPVQSAPQSAPLNQSIYINTLSSTPSTLQNTSSQQALPITIAVPISHAPISIKTKPSTPIGYKTLRDPPKSWNSQINSQIARVNQNVKAQQLANAVAAASQGGVVNAQGRFTGDLKSVRPAKFFKGRNMPRYLGCPASGVKPMYQVQASADKEKAQEQQTALPIKSEKSEIKKHSIVKIDPRTLRPISEKAPETSNLSNISSNLGMVTSQNSQELRINSSQGDLKINTSSVSIFNPLKLQSSPKSERKSPKSPHSPKVKSSPNGNQASAVTTNTTPSSPSPSNTLSPKQHRDKTNLTFTPPNPFVPNLTSPTLSPNQFLYPAGGFPSYDPRVMAAYHSLWYTQRMAAAAAAGFVPPPMPHAFSMNIGLNTGTPTMGQQQHSPGISPKHSTPPKTSGQPSPRGNNTTPSQKSKPSPTTPNKKTKELNAKNEKSLETALNKLSQNKAKELGENKLMGGNKQQLGGNKKVGGSKELVVENSMPVDAQRSSSPQVLGGSKVLGGHNSLGDPQHRISSPKILGGNKKTTDNQDLGGNNKDLGENTFTLVEPQQARPSPKDPGRSSSMISALEKLSQNKAIEILGGDMGGKRTSIRPDDGRSSPMSGPYKDKGSSTPPATNKPILTNEITKQQSSSTEINTRQQTVSENMTKSSTPAQDLNQSLEISHQASTPSELKSVSPALQTRLGQCHDTSNNPNSSDESVKNVKEQQDRSELRQNGSDQGNNGSNQDENRPDSDQRVGLGSSETNQNVVAPQQSGESKFEGENKESANNVSKVIFSDKTKSNGEEKQSILDSSDIKASSSLNSVDICQNSSDTNNVKLSGTCDNAGFFKPSEDIADKALIGTVASGESSEVPVNSGNIAGSNELAAKDAVASDKSGNGETKSNDNVTKSDTGGGEKKE